MWRLVAISMLTLAAVAAFMWANQASPTPIRAQRAGAITRVDTFGTIERAAVGALPTERELAVDAACGAVAGAPASLAGG